METAPVRIAGEWRIPYNYTIGDFASQFFQALREGRILGCRCDSCGRVSVPPKSFCEFCFLPVTTLTDIGHSGVIEAVTIVTAPFAGSPPVPYAVAYVRLDGATAAIANYIRGVDLPEDVHELPAQVRIGADVHAVFSPEPDGRVTDFWFEPGRE
jgi:uncharacterized OB-fold protein